MKKYLKFFVVIVFALFIFVGCKSKAAIVGTWEYKGMEAAYVFNDDKTGKYVFFGQELKFTYEDDGKVLKIKYDDADNVSEFQYTIDGKKLTIKDSLGSDVEYFKK